MCYPVSSCVTKAAGPQQKCFSDGEEPGAFDVRKRAAELVKCHEEEVEKNIEGVTAVITKSWGSVVIPCVPVLVVKGVSYKGNRLF